LTKSLRPARCSGIDLSQGYAFTLEKAALTADLLARFATDVLARQWKGARSVWIAPEEAGGELAPFPAEYDHLRAVPVRKEPTKDPS